MEGGKIIIEGDAGMWAGIWMRGGTIRILGNANICLGESMTGGLIEVHGRLEDDPETLEFYRSKGLEASPIGNVLGGRIMHRGECIVDK
jgi:formylmethanofuran dehydrogenase subunit C